MERVDQDRSNQTLLTNDIGNESLISQIDSGMVTGSAWIRITFYTLIFLVSLIGNSLVFITLAQHRGMRTVTNVFLLNLSISDLLLTVFCMPFTLIPTLLRNFTFGNIMCVLIRYMQGVSVGVSVFTLVAISMERYFAICQPLRSRTWQTLCHAYKLIAFVWLLSLGIMVPIAVFHKLVPLTFGGHKCIEKWPAEWERVYSLLLLLLLLVIPLLLMLIAYACISATLAKAAQLEIRELRQLHTAVAEREAESEDEIHYNHDKHRVMRPSFAAPPRHTRIRLSSTQRSLQAKKRGIKMLFVVVLEFFVCWTPMYVMQTWFVFDEESAIKHVSPVAMNFIHLISYVSSCCNPITYCFMSHKFREGFISAFRCCCPGKRQRQRYRSSIWSGHHRLSSSPQSQNGQTI